MSFTQVEIEAFFIAVGFLLAFSIFIIARYSTGSFIRRIGSFVFTVSFMASLLAVAFMFTSLIMDPDVIMELAAPGVTTFVGTFMFLFLFRFLFPSVKPEKVTDIRKMDIPKKVPRFDIDRYTRDDSIAVGMKLNKRQTLRIPLSIADESHWQVAGTSGTGKTVAVQILLKQRISMGLPVFVFDPKDDKFLPQVLYRAAKKARIPYHYINLKSDEAQVNPFLGATEYEIKDLMFAAFRLANTGEASDHYRAGDRESAVKAAKVLNLMKHPSLRAILGYVMDEDEFPHKGFRQSFGEMANIAAINAKTPGVDFDTIMKGGGVVYVVGSTTNIQIMLAMQLLISKMVQMGFRRDRLKKHPIATAFFDEFKYCCCPAALSVFSTLRDRGVLGVAAHQSNMDFEDIPCMRPRAVYGALVDNTPVKVIYRIEDPDTVDWLSRKSGTKTVVRESINDRDEVIRSELSVPLIEPNMIMSLPKGIAVVFGAGDIATLCGTSPQQVKLTKLAVRVTPQPLAEPLDSIDPAESADKPIEKPSLLLRLWMWLVKRKKTPEPIVVKESQVKPKLPVKAKQKKTSKVKSAPVASRESKAPESQASSGELPEKKSAVKPKPKVPRKKTSKVKPAPVAPRESKAPEPQPVTPSDEPPPDFGDWPEFDYDDVIVDQNAKNMS